MCSQGWKPFASCHVRQESSEGEFESHKWRKTITEDPDGIYGYSEHLKSLPIQADCELHTVKGANTKQLKTALSVI